MTEASGRAGVLLMTYGSPASLEREDIAAYLARVRGGREPGPELVDEFTRRYRVIGGSPLVEITRSQASALADLTGWPTAVGMRFSAPSITDGLRDLAQRGVDRIAAIVLSPQFSPLLMGGYARAVEAARAELGDGAPRVEIAEAWHTEPAFVAALARRVRDALGRLPSPERERSTVLLTAHSLPRRVAEQEPDYLVQLRDTARAVAAAAGLADDRWEYCWQSAGHEPGEWMKPDFADLMPAVAAAGDRSVVVAPVQFLADHLEVLYDVDVGAREQAERCGLAFQRVESLNADPGLIEALAAVAARTLRRGPITRRSTVTSPL
ncbi:MAG: protoporphyrin/coproporphyrin ferrochelatase [Chloroflexota bacterium]|jgi:ferrochelatase|nr:protoporphyrin/coproporphyrin ferrochelatase [Chloroflexota bacterium]